MKLAPAKPLDAARLGQIMAAWINETPWMPKLHTLDGDTKFLTRLIETMDVITLRNLRGPEGFLAREDEEVQALYLAPQARSNGWGSQMLGLAKARSPRLELWTFQANTRARAFYAREGFTEVKLTDGQGNDEKLPDVRMVWNRNPQ